MISSMMLMQMTEQSLAAAEEQEDTPKFYQVRAYDSEGNRISYIGGFDLNKDMFENSAEVKEKLEPAISAYNTDISYIYPIVRVEVYLNRLIAEAPVEFVRKIVTEYKDTSEIGEYSYTLR